MPPSGQSRTSNGHVRMVLDNDTKASLKRAGVITDSMINPGQYTVSNVWVPRWVRDAINLFKKSDGFAGMSLEEFLISIKPNK